MKNSKHFLIFALGLLVALVLLNLLSLDTFGRFDLTRDKKYTLAFASKETLAKLDDTITVSAYFTEALPPPYAQHARYVNDLLDEYLANSSGKFAYEFIDPMKNVSEDDKAKVKDIKRDIFGRLVREQTSKEKELEGLGLQPVQIRVIDNDAQQTRRAYMGIVIRYQDKHEVIPVVQNLNDLEKDMTSLMRKLIRSKTPVLGLIKDQMGPSLQKLNQLMAENLSVKPLDLSTQESIPDEYDAILIAGLGDHLGENAAQKIDQFLAKGKSAAVFVDRHQVNPQSFQIMPKTLSKNSLAVIDLLKEYGILVGDQLVADATCASLNMQEQRGGFSFTLPVKYPFVPELLNLSFDSPVTKGLSGVILPFVTNIEVEEKSGWNTSVLASSSKVSWTEANPPDINPRRDWGSANVVPNGPHDLIVQARGQLPTTNQEEKNPESRLFVMGTSAFMWDDFLSHQNQVLALNIVDWMLADSALLEMRARSFSDAPLDTELADSVRQSVKYGNIFGVPLLLIIYGLYRWRMREMKRSKLRREQA